MTDEDIPHPEILTTQLAPCPFCAQPPMINTFDTLDGPEWQIDCENPECGATASSNACDSFEEAARVWNTRIPPPTERTRK